MGIGVGGKDRWEGATGDEEPLPQVSASSLHTSAAPHLRLVSLASAIIVPQATSVAPTQGGLVFGYDIGGSGGSFVMIGFRQHFGWPVPIPQDGEEPRYVLVQMSLINALFPLGALFGALLAGTLADSLGRCPAITGSALLFTVAAALQVC